MINNRGFIKLKYLALGIILVFLAWILSSLNVIGISRNFGFQIFSNMSMIFVLSFILIIIPFLEEVGFRLLIKTRKKVNYAISILLASFFMFFTLNMVLAILCSLLLSVTVYLYLHNKNYAVDLQIVIASLFFSLLHFGDSISTTNHFSLAIYFLYFFGMGLVLSWIKINFSLLASFLVHATFNGFFIALMIYQGHNSKIVNVNCNDVNFSYKEELFFGHSSQGGSIKEDSTLVLSNSNLVRMLDLFLPEQQVKENYYQTNIFIKYDIEIYRFYESDPEELLNCLVDENLIIKK